MNLQCSVCWEDFKIEEQVRKLLCEHVYHENCIVPWLELVSTFIRCIVLITLILYYDLILKRCVENRLNSLHLKCSKKIPKLTYIQHYNYIIFCKKYLLLATSSFCTMVTIFSAFPL